MFSFLQVFLYFVALKIRRNNLFQVSPRLKEHCLNLQRQSQGKYLRAFASPLGKNGQVVILRLRDPQAGNNSVKNIYKNTFPVPVAVISLTMLFQIIQNIIDLFQPSELAQVSAIIWSKSISSRLFLQWQILHMQWLNKKSPINTTLQTMVI